MSTNTNHTGIWSELGQLIGHNNVITNDQEIDKRSLDLIPNTKKPGAFAYPDNIDQVMALTRWANTHSIPLWPVSTGKNWGYGAATPAIEGALVVSLEKLNRILTVDADLGFVVVEPGVTYRQLHEHLRRNNIPFWLDCTDGPADGSVMGNALERGVGETDYGDHFGNICGLEIILPDASLLRTGGGPADNYRSWNTYKWGVGPYIEGLFSQSNLGIVTKMGMWLRPIPDYFTSCLFELKREEDFPLMIDALRKLQLHGHLQSKIHIINDVVSFAVAVEHPQELLQGAQTLSRERILELRKSLGSASWIFAAGIYGTKEQVIASKKKIKKLLGKMGDVNFIDDRLLSIVKVLLQFLKWIKGLKSLGRFADRLSMFLLNKPVNLLAFIPELHAIEKGCPSDYFVRHAYYKSKTPKPTTDVVNPAKDRCGLIWLGPMVPMKGDEVEKVLDMVRSLYVKHGFDFTTALMVGNPRTVIALMSVFYDKNDPDESKRAAALYYEMGDVTQKAGYQQYRTSTMYMDRIFSNAPEFLSFCQKLKKAIDPQGIIAPGKYGIS